MSESCLSHDVTCALCCYIIEIAPGGPKGTQVKYLVQPGFTRPQTPVPIGYRDNWVHFAQNVLHLQEVPAVPR